MRGQVGAHHNVTLLVDIASMCNSRLVRIMQPEIDLGSDNHLVITKSIVLERTLSRKANCKYVHRREFELCPWLAERNKNRNLMEKTLNNRTALIAQTSQSMSLDLAIHHCSQLQVETK